MLFFRIINQKSNKDNRNDHGHLQVIYLRTVGKDKEKENS